MNYIYDHKKDSIISAFGIYGEKRAELSEYFNKARKSDENESERLESLINDDDLSLEEKVLISYLYGRSFSPMPDIGGILGAFGIDVKEIDLDDEDLEEDE